MGWTWARIAERMGTSRQACHAIFKRLVGQQSRRKAWGLLSGRTATALTKLGYRDWRQFIDCQPTRGALLTARGVGQRTLAEIERLLGAPLPPDLPLRHRSDEGRRHLRLVGDGAGVPEPVRRRKRAEETGAGYEWAHGLGAAGRRTPAEPIAESEVSRHQPVRSEHD